MSVIDVLTRVDAICKKYDKYEVEKQRADDNSVSGDDGFSRLYSSVEADIEAALRKAEVASHEKNRAAAAFLNAEIRRIKARLTEEVPKLKRLSAKKVKGISKEELPTRNNLVLALSERIESIPDGTVTAAKQGGGLGASHTGIRFASTSDGRFDSEIFQPTEESNQFRQEFEMRKMKQDEAFGGISESLDTIKNLALDMKEELERQVPLTDEIDTKVDRANADMKTTNRRLKDTVNQLRSSQNFCIDIIILCVILGIAAYLYDVLRK